MRRLSASEDTIIKAVIINMISGNVRDNILKEIDEKGWWGSHSSEERAAKLNHIMQHVIRTPYDISELNNKPKKKS